MSSPDPESALVRLRPYRAADRAPFVALVTDADVMRFMGGPVPKDSAHERLGVFVAGGRRPMVCVRAAEEGGAYVGHAFLLERREPPGIEVGFVVRPDHRGRGLGTAIAREMVAIGFDELCLTSVMGTVDLDNEASIRVLQKAGFEEEGLRHDDEGPYRLFRISKPA